MSTALIQSFVQALLEHDEERLLSTVGHLNPALGTRAQNVHTVLSTGGNVAGDTDGGEKVGVTSSSAKPFSFNFVV
jgi:hypothetical protein